MSYYVDYYDDYVAEPRPDRWLIDLTPVYRDNLWSYGGQPLDTSTATAKRPSTTTTKRPPPAVRTQETIVDRLLRESLEIVEEKRRLEQTRVDDVPHTVVESDRDDNTQLSPYVPLTILAFIVWYVWRRERRRK